MNSLDLIRCGLISSGVVAVIRTESPEPILEIARALVRGNVRALEVTLTVPGAVEVILELRREWGDQAFVGAGTVLDGKGCREVIEAGAQFLVSPIARTSLAPIAKEAGRVLMLGAYTPTEAQAVHESGADFVKVFPCDGLGTAYIRSLLAPLPHLRIVPTGGVDLKTAPEYIRAGCAAVGAGSSLIPKEMVRDRRWEELTAHAAAFSQAVAEARPGRGA